MSDVHAICYSVHNLIWLSLPILVYATASDVMVGRKLCKPSPHTHPHPHKECYPYLPPTVVLPGKQVGYIIAFLGSGLA